MDKKIKSKQNLNYSGILKNGEEVINQLILISENSKIKDVLLKNQYFHSNHKNLDDFIDDLSWALYFSFESIIVQERERNAMSPDTVRDNIRNITNSLTQIELSFKSSKIRSIFLDALSFESNVLDAVRNLENFETMCSQIKTISGSIPDDHHHYKDNDYRIEKVIRKMKTKNNSKRPDIYLMIYFIYPLIKERLLSVKESTNLLHDLIIEILPLCRQQPLWPSPIKDTSLLYPSEFKRIVKSLKL